MSTAAQRGARAALDAARPAAARLDASRNSEDLAADLIELWSAVEAALRVLVGSSALTGQPLIREARQRQMIDFDLANSLAEFEAVHGRLQNTSYKATAADVKSARDAYLKLDAALSTELGASAFDAPRPAPVPPGVGPTASTTGFGNATAPGAVANPGPSVPPSVANTTPGRRSRPVVLAASAVLVVILIVAGFLVFGRGNTGDLQQGVTAYRAGQREVAVSAFTRASRADPKAPLPHIYLARMAREVGNFTEASQELQTALQIDPNNALALREMGANMLAQGNNELARRFYVRAVQADPTDKTSQGYLGCALMRLNRTSEGTTFINRAGPGPWSNCTPTGPGATGTAAGTAALSSGSTTIPR